MFRHAGAHVGSFADVERVVRTSQDVDKVHADDDAIVESNRLDGGNCGVAMQSTAACGPSTRRDPEARSGHSP